MRAAGIINELDLLDALNSGKVAGAALDVYSVEPPPQDLEGLIRHPAVVATPHIAASTEEAQRKVAVQVANNMVKVLKGQPVDSSVNAVALAAGADPTVGPLVDLAGRLGSVAAQLADAHITTVVTTVRGDIPRKSLPIVGLAALKGVLSDLLEEQVNLVNAGILASDAGLIVEERLSSEQEGYLVSVEVQLLDGKTVLAEVRGALFGNRPKIVQIADFQVEIDPSGWILCYENIDKPGMLAAVGAVLAAEGVNIGSMALGRTRPGARALTVMHVDEAVEPTVLAQIGLISGVEKVHLLALE